MTFTDFCTEAKARAFPEGVSENLDELYDKRVVNALTEAQRYCPRLRSCNFTRTTFDSAYFQFGLSLVSKPAGKVLEVYTYSVPDQSDRVFYTLSDAGTVRKLLDAEAFAQPDPVIRTTNTGEVYSTAYEAGLYPAHETQDKGFRANSGLFYLDEIPSVNGEDVNPGGHFVVLHPNLESSETVMIRWLGKKTSYAVDDEVSFVVGGVDYLEPVYNYVEAHLRMEAAAKEDRSVSDTQLFASARAAALRDLLLDIKDDTEAEEPVNR